MRVDWANLGDLNSTRKSVFTDDEVEPLLLRLVREARRSVTLISPYLDLWTHLEDALDQAINRGIAVTFVVREDRERKPKSEDWLSRRKVKVLRLPWLHAKIYLNESTVVVSSMNITDVSTTNAHDFAMIVREKADEDVLRRYVLGLVKGAKPVLKERIEKAGERKGTCIRRGEEIDFDPKKPMCNKCYQLWAEYNNPDYQERYCHSCGKEREVTLARPLCRDCFRKQN